MSNCACINYERKSWEEIILKKLKLSFLVSFVVTIVFVFMSFKQNVSANSIKQYNGVPERLQYKYWGVKATAHRHAEYFFGNKVNFSAKHTDLGTFTSTQISYIKIRGSYVMTGTDPKNAQNVIWWFVKPINRKKIKLGFESVSMKSVPKYAPNHYETKVAKRVSSVTAILH